MISWRGAMYKAWCATLCVVALLSPHDTLARTATVGEVDAEITLLALGTSLTANYHWPRELAGQLSRCLARKVRIESLAVAGESSDQAAKQFSLRTIQKPDIVLVEFATNDANILRGIDLDASQRNHKALLGRIRADAPDAHVLLMTMNPAFGPRGWVRPRLYRYFEMYRQFAASNDVVLVDLALIWSETILTSSYEAQLPDGLHPTQSVATRNILPTLRNTIGGLLRNRMPNSCEIGP